MHTTATIKCGHNKGNILYGSNSWPSGYEDKEYANTIIIVIKE